MIAARWKLVAAAAVVSGSALLLGRAASLEPAPAPDTAAAAPASRPTSYAAAPSAALPRAAPAAAAVDDPAPALPDIEDGAVADAAVAASLEADLKAEPVDGKWLGEMRERAGGFFAAEAQRGASLRDLTCGRALCRAQIGLRDRAALDALVADVSGLLPPGGEGYAYLDSDGDLEIEVFLSRSGPLPH